MYGAVQKSYKETVANVFFFLNQFFSGQPLPNRSVLHVSLRTDLQLSVRSTESLHHSDVLRL